MNTKRVAALLRELADELERDAPANDAGPKVKKPRREVPQHATRPPTDLDRARAAAALRRLGYKVKP